MPAKNDIIMSTLVLLVVKKTQETRTRLGQNLKKILKNELEIRLLEIQEKLRNTPKCQIRHQKITMMFSLYQRRITMNHEEKKENGKKCFKGCVTFYLHSGYISFCFESKLPGAARPLQVLAFHL